MLHISISSVGSGLWGWVTVITQCVCLCVKDLITEENSWSDAWFSVEAARYCSCNFEQKATDHVESCTAIRGPSSHSALSHLLVLVEATELWPDMQWILAIICVGRREALRWCKRKGSLPRPCGTTMDFFVIYVNILCLSHSFTVCMFYNITVNTHDFNLYLI